MSIGNIRPSQTCSGISETLCVLGAISGTGNTPAVWVIMTDKAPFTIVKEIEACFLDANDKVFVCPIRQDWAARMDDGDSDWIRRTCI